MIYVLPNNILIKWLHHQSNLPKSKENIHKVNQEAKQDTSTHNIFEHISPLETNDPGFISSQWQLESDAPLFIKNYIDERIPLMEKDKYVPIPTPGNFNVIFSLAIAVLISSYVYKQHHALIVSDMPLFRVETFIAVAFIMFAFFFLIFALYKFKNIQKIKQLKQQNKYRQGMFVLKDAIILQRGIRYCYLPKKNIWEFNLSNENKNPKLLILIKTNNKQNQSYNLNFLRADNRELKKALTNWHESGIWLYSGTFHELCKGFFLKV